MLRVRHKQIKVSVKQYAAMEQVSIRTVQRWVAARLVKFEQRAKKHPIRIIVEPYDI